MLAMTIVILTTTSASAVEIFSEDFEGTINSGDPGTNTRPDGVFSGYTSGWLNTPFTGNGNSIKPAAGSAWLNPVPAALGTTFGTLWGGSTQTTPVGSNFQAETQYTLSFTHFRRDDLVGDSVTASIMTTGGTTLATQTFGAVANTGEFITREVTYTTGAAGAEIGQGIQLRFTDPNGGTPQQQPGIDNISLDAVDVSGPCSAGSLVADVETEFTDNLICAVEGDTFDIGAIGTSRFSEVHLSGSGGRVLEWARGAGDPVDSSREVASWTSTGSEIEYDYDGGSPYTYEIHKIGVDYYYCRAGETEPVVTGRLVTSPAGANPCGWSLF